MDPQPVRLFFGQIVKWSRRLTAFGAWLLVIIAVRTGDWPIQQITAFLGAHFPSVPGVVVSRLTTAFLIVWYAFLTELKIRWALWLPLYALVYPPYTVLKLLGKAALLAFATATKAAWVLLRPIVEGAARSVGLAPAIQSQRKRLPIKRLWLLMFFLWLAAFRGIDAWWAIWIAPLLAVPLWVFFLRVAYRLSVSPKTFVELVAKGSATFLDNQRKEIEKAKAAGKSTTSFGGSHDFVQRLLERYSEDRVAEVIQKEAMAMFFVALSFGLLASSVFWGLIGLAILETNPRALDAYQFFRGVNLLEAITWAWGCMTTTIDFPGREASMWVKLTHGFILATGVFQITFLLACFSIMINLQTVRTVAAATALLTTARTKLDESRKLVFVEVKADDVAQIGDSTSQSETDKPATDHRKPEKSEPDG